MNKEKPMFPIVDGERKLFNNGSMGARNKAPPTPYHRMLFQNEKGLKNGSPRFSSDHVTKNYKRNYDLNRVWD